MGKRRVITYLDAIVFLDVGMRVPDGSSVMSDDVWDLVLAHGLSLDAAELECGLLSIDLVGLESALHVVEDSEVLSCFLNADNVHNSEWESVVSSDLSVDLDQAFLVVSDLDGLLARNCISQSISKENTHRNAFSSFVGSS